VPSRLFRRLVLQTLIAAHRLQFFGANAALADTNAFAWGRMDVYLSFVY
jgi:hypothetical protein